VNLVKELLREGDGAMAALKTGSDMLKGVVKTGVVKKEPK